MTWFIIIILIALWYLGLTSSYSFGGFIHVLLILAAIVFISKFVKKRKVDL